MGDTGVDEHADISLEYADGQTASLSCSFRENTPLLATIIGTAGQIRVAAPWFRGTELWVGVADAEPPDQSRHDAAGRMLRAGRKLARLFGNRDEEAGETHRLPIQGSGYRYEAMEVDRCLRAGLTESTIMPLDETRAIMETMDGLRASWGVHLSTESSQAPPASLRPDG